MRLFFFLVLELALAAGCSSEGNKERPRVPGPSTNSAEPTARLAGLPVEMTVRQRSTTAPPGSEGALSVTVDDVTHGQVMVSLAGEGGAAVLAPTSLTEGASVEFKLSGETYYLLLKELRNELVGDDSATLVISDSPPDGAPATRAGGEDAPAHGDAPAHADAEAARIEQLLEHVGALEGAVFVRNGEEHAPAEAVAHLRRKLDAAGDEIATAEQFVEELATKSSLSGEPYVIRWEDGKETPAGEYLRQQLAEMEGTP